MASELLNIQGRCVRELLLFIFHTQFFFIPPQTKPKQNEKNRNPNPTTTTLSLSPPTPPHRNDEEGCCFSPGTPYFTFVHQFCFALGLYTGKKAHVQTHTYTHREQNTIARATHTHTHAQEQTLFTACSARGDLGSVILSLRGKQRYLPTNTFFLPNSDYVDVNGILPKKNFKSHKSTR